MQFTLNARLGILTHRWWWYVTVTAVMLVASFLTPAALY